MKSLLLVFTLLVMISTTAQRVSNKTVKVKPYMSLQNYEHFKRLIINANKTNVEFIEDFDFEWGYDYKLKIEVTKLKEVSSDGTRFEHKLIKVISKTKVSVGTEFKMRIDPLRYYHQTENAIKNKTIVSLNDSTYSYFDKVEIEVPKELRSTFVKLTNSENSKMGNFEFTAEGRIRLMKFE